MRLIFALFFLSQFFCAIAQQPFISDYYTVKQPLADSIPKLKLVGMMGDSRWMHPYILSEGDARYVANDSIIVIAGGDYLTAWSSEEGELLWEYRFQHDPKQSSSNTRSLRASTEKPWVLAANDKKGISIFNYYTGQHLDSFSIVNDFRYGDISPSGEWVVVYGLYTGWEVWNISKRALSYNSLAITSAAVFSPDSKSLYLISPNSYYYSLHRLDLETGQHILIKDSVATGNTRVQTIECSPDGELIALAHWGGQLTILDTNTGDYILKEQVEPLNRGWMDALDFTQDGQRLLAMGSSTIVTWERGSDTLQKHSADCLQTSWSDGQWSKDGEHILLASREWQRPGRFRLDDLCQDLYPTSFHYAAPSQITFSPDAKYLASMGMDNNGGSVLFLDNKKQVFSKRLSTPEGVWGFEQIRFSTTGKYFAVLFYPIKTNTNMLYSFPKLEALDLAVNGREICFGPRDESLIGITFPSGGSVFDYQFEIKAIGKKSPKLIKTAEGLKAAFDESSDVLRKGLWQSHSTNLAHWLNTKAESLLPVHPAKWHGPPSQVFCEHMFGGFDQEAKRYAGLGNDGHLYVYDAETGQPLAAASLQGRSSWTVAIGPKGKYVAMVGWDSLIYLYEMPF